MRKLSLAFLLLFAVSLSAQESELVIARQTIERTNAYLANTGSDVRIVKASFFMRGQGVPDFRGLRTGLKWPYRDLSYVVDVSDLTSDVPAPGSMGAIVSAYNTWNNIPNSGITTHQIADDGTNFDILDGTFVGGNCVTLLDLTSPNFHASTGSFTPEADIVVGGWMPPSYFSSCFGSTAILGITLILGAGDVNGDNYTDELYAEQFYNEGFSWVLNGSTFLGPTEDIETVVLHEAGHALGLDHMGGPNPNEPFKLQPNGKVFDPEAVMNPFYLGGEKRSPFPTDIAGLRTLYANPR